MLLSTTLVPNNVTVLTFTIPQGHVFFPVLQELSSLTTWLPVKNVMPFVKNVQKLQPIVPNVKELSGITTTALMSVLTTTMWTVITIADSAAVIHRLVPFHPSTTLSTHKLYDINCSS